jgi:Phage portal protein
MSDNAQSIAFNENAPQDERNDALAELQKSHTTTSLSDLIPSEAVQEVISKIHADYQDEALRKSMNPNIVPFPSKYAKEHKRGMQSIQLDDWQLSVQGDFWERPSALGFDSLRMMVEQTPILNAIVMTRVRQVQRFARVAESNKDAPGFEIKHIDKSHQLNNAEQESIHQLNRFIGNCGWEFSPRRRKALRRDSFAQFLGKVARDTLTMDSVGIETEWKRDKALGMDGFYAVDGGSVRLCTEQGYHGDDEIFALQVVQGRVSAAYTFDDLIYEPRNPRSDVAVCGYGLPETELLVRVVTGFLNALTYNIKGFDNNAIPKGMLHLSGNYTNQDLDAFKRYWNSMVKGINNQWSLPVMVSKDQDSKASFEKFGVDFDEMRFSKFMTFLTSIACAIYGMSPAEINFDSFTAGSSSPMAGSDTAEKLAASKDSGLRPLLSYFENLITDYIVSDFSDKYVFRWTGLDPQNADEKFELRKMLLTVNEARAEEGYEAIDGPLGDAPLNPQLITPWMQLTQQQQPEQPDFGQPSQGAEQAGQGEKKSDTVETKLDSDTVEPAQDEQGAEPAQPAQAAEPAPGSDSMNKSFNGHKGRPGHQGGSQAKSSADVEDDYSAHLPDSSKINTLEEADKYFKDNIEGNWAITIKRKAGFFDVNVNFKQNQEHAYTRKNQSTGKRDFEVKRASRMQYIVDCIAKPDTILGNGSRDLFLEKNINGINYAVVLDWFGSKKEYRFRSAHCWSKEELAVKRKDYDLPAPKGKKSTNNKAPEKLSKSLGALIKVTEELDKSSVSASARFLDLTAPPLPIYQASREHLSDRLSWGLDSDGFPHEHDFNCMADFVKSLGGWNEFNPKTEALDFGTPVQVIYTIE